MGEVAEIADATEHVLADGGRVLVRPVVPSDRDELAAGYRRLSSRSRHTRFFSPPDDLDDDDLDYLTILDYRDHFAVAAFLLDEPGQPGVAVARYVRDPDDPSRAEVAITVLDDHQRRGIGTLLMQRLAAVAATNDIDTFVQFVLWDNDDMVGLLRAQGATVEPDEPGVARLELALPVSASS
jgi:GNAT superfamily N-acetyltransferase